MTTERVGFEDWLGITPKGAAHDLAYEAFKAGAAWQRTQSAGVPEGWRRAVYHAEECLTGCLATPHIARWLDVETVRKIIADLQVTRFALLAASTGQEVGKP